MAAAWPRLVTCPLTRRLNKKRVPCGNLQAIGWNPEGPPAYYRCTHCRTKWTSRDVGALIKARSHVSLFVLPEPYVAPELPGFGDLE